MINLNVNRIEARLNIPGPNLITPVYYMVIGGGFRGSKVLGSPGGQSGEFLSGSFGLLHQTTATFRIGRGALGQNSPTSGLAAVASSSLLEYPTDSLTVTAQPGSGSAQDCNPSVPDATGPCNSKGPWIIDPSTYNAWAQDGGKSYDVPGTGDDRYGTGGGLGATFPWPTNRGDASQGGEAAGMPAYNGSGGGGGSGIDASVSGNSGDGADGVVGLAIYDPNEIFDVTFVAPTRQGADVQRDQTIETYNGYRVWYFHGTASTGSFTIHGRNQ
jgi:hypothetical protein